MLNLFEIIESNLSFKTYKLYSVCLNMITIRGNLFLSILYLHIFGEESSVYLDIWRTYFKKYLNQSQCFQYF